MRLAPPRSCPQALSYQSRFALRDAACPDCFAFPSGQCLATLLGLWGQTMNQNEWPPQFADDVSARRINVAETPDGAPRLLRLSLRLMARNEGDGKANRRVLFSCQGGIPQPLAPSPRYSHARGAGGQRRLHSRAQRPGRSLIQRKQGGRRFPGGLLGFP
jgi:hypothetical protein